MLVTGQLKGQLICHACQSGPNASCVHTVFLHFAELTVVVVIFCEMYNQYLASFSNFVIALINRQQYFVSSNSVCNYAHD